MEWIKLKDRLPYIDDLPFVTIDKIGLFEVWDDMDWHSEVEPYPDMLSEYVYWTPLKDIPKQ